MRALTILVAVLVATSLVAGASGVAAAGADDKHDEKDKYDDKKDKYDDKKEKKHKKDKKDKKKPKKPGDGQNERVTLCHVPPGNPANAHTITVSENAVDAHLAHGDYLGPCECGP